jgi:radical SAM superfamily enzyme YgiQ (UPF0313 family)
VGRCLLILPASSESREVFNITGAMSSGVQELFLFLLQNGEAVDLLDYDKRMFFSGEAGTCRPLPAVTNAIDEAFEDARYDVVGISVQVSYRYAHAQELIRRIRVQHKYAGMIVLGGLHAASCPHEFLDSVPEHAANFVVRGQGERILLALVRNEDLSSFGTLTPGVLSEPANAAACLPEVDYDPRKISNLCESRSLLVNFSRGCIGQCTYCAERPLSGRYRSVGIDQFQRTMQRLAAIPGLDYIMVTDPLFGADRTWRRQAFQYLRTIRSMSILIMERVDCMDQEDYELLDDSRVVIDFGIESLSPTMLTIMHKTGQPDLYLENVEQAAMYGKCEMRANFLFNHPGETPETTHETISGIRRMVDDYGMRFRFMTFEYALFPGTYVYTHRSEYERLYGSRFLVPEWWRASSNHWNLARACVPSGMFGQTIPEMMRNKRRWEDQLRAVIGQW